MVVAVQPLGVHRSSEFSMICSQFTGNTTRPIMRIAFSARNAAKRGSSGRGSGPEVREQDAAELLDRVGVGADAVAESRVVALEGWLRQRRAP
jgi:hypothetical protein